MSAPPARVRGTRDVLGLVGVSLGPSDWLSITQERIDAFAQAVDDWHWAHNDPRRAALGPFRGTVGHAHLTLGVIPGLFHALLRFCDGTDAMFYGYDRVRFPGPVRVGSRLRLLAAITEVVEIPDAEQLVVDLELENDASDRPACVARALFRHYRSAPTA
jgi:acyl dehydratase